MILFLHYHFIKIACMESNKDYRSKARDQTNCKQHFYSLKTSCKMDFSTRGKKVEAILEFFHFDVCGLMQIATFGGVKYFISFIDDYFKFITIYFLKYKSKFLKIFKYSNIQSHGGKSNYK